jgi:hypothetical protein
MANREVITNFCQIHYPHLVTPQKPRKEGDVGKYGLRMAFPMVGTLPAHIGTESTDISNIQIALEEVCQEEWGCSFQDAPEIRSIAYPPKWVNGDHDWKKDDNGNKLINQPNEASVGKWLMGAKNTDPIGCADHTGGIELNPKEVYAGCWGRVELLVSAYTLEDKTSIIVIKVVNIQKCFDDESIGGGAGPARKSTQTFANMAVTNSNCQPTGFAGQAKQATGPASPSKRIYTMTPAAGEFTREVYLAIDGWTDELLVSNGYMTITEPAAPATPAGPASPSKPAGLAGPSAPGKQYLAPPASPSKPAGPTYTMTALAGEFTREVYLAIEGWTDELLVSEGLMTITQDSAPASPASPSKPAGPALPGMPK